MKYTNFDVNLRKEVRKLGLRNTVRNRVGTKLKDCRQERSLVLPLS